MLVGPLMDVKEFVKVRNRQVTKSRIVLIRIPLILVKKFVPRQLIRECRYCSLNNTNELRLLVRTCFWVKEGIDVRTNQVEKTLYTGYNYGVPFFVTGITPHGRLESIVLHFLVQNT